MRKVRFLVLAVIFNSFSFLQMKMSQAQINFEGDIEANWDYEATSSKPEDTDATETKSNKLEGNGTFALLSKTSKGNYFANAKIQTKLNFAGTVVPEDVFMKVGKTGSWDITVGHFEALELFSKGQDTLLSTAEGGNINSVNDARGRAAGAIMPQMHFGDLSLQLNILTKTGSQKHSSVADEETATNYVAYRPAIQYISGAFSVALGLESVQESAQNSKSDALNRRIENAGLKLKFDQESYYVALSIGSRKESGNDAFDNILDENTEMSAGLVALFTGLGPGKLGLGFFNNTKEVKDKQDVVTQVQYLSYAMPLLTDKSGFAIGINNSLSEIKPKTEAKTKNSNQSLRFRFTYTL